MTKGIRPKRLVDQIVTARHDPALLAAHRPARRRGGGRPLKGTVDPMLVDMARVHSIATAQVVLRWHLEHGIAVPEVDEPERIAANST